MYDDENDPILGVVGMDVHRVSKSGGTFRRAGPTHPLYLEGSA